MVYIEMAVGAKGGNGVLVFSDQVKKGFLFALVKFKSV